MFFNTKTLALLIFKFTGSKGIKKKAKIVEEEDIGEYPCPVCSDFFDRISLLDKHAKEAHPGLKV